MGKEGAEGRQERGRFRSKLEISRGRVTDILTGEMGRRMALKGGIQASLKWRRIKSQFRVGILQFALTIWVFYA